MRSIRALESDLATAEDGIATTTKALDKFPDDPVYTRSLQWWVSRRETAMNDLAIRRTTMAVRFTQEELQLAIIALDAPSLGIDASILRARFLGASRKLTEGY